MAHSQYLSNVFLYGANEDKGYSLDIQTVTISTGTGANTEMRSGAVLDASFDWVLAATVGNATCVLADERADAEVVLANGDHSLKCIMRSAGVGSNYLTFGDTVTGGNIATATAALLALGIKAEAQA